MNLEKVGKVQVIQMGALHESQYKYNRWELQIQKVERAACLYSQGGCYYLSSKELQIFQFLDS
jgi:hypothetical protein